jgi:plasmid stability protein
MMQGKEEPMASLQIRDMPPDVYGALAARAKAENRSMAQQAIVELRRLPELAVRETRKQALAELRERRRQSGLRELSIPAEQLIREDRER